MVDYVDPVLNKATARGHFTPVDQVTDEIGNLDDAAYEECMDRVRKDKERNLANQAALRELALRMSEEMPELDPDSGAEEEDNSSDDDADKDTDDENESSHDEEEEDIPDLQPEDDESPAGELAKALKAFLGHSEEGEIRLTISDVSIVQEGDLRDPSMYQLQRRIDGKEGLQVRQLRAAPAKHGGKEGADQGLPARPQSGF